jgi:hypothetical protein
MPRHTLALTLTLTAGLGLAQAASATVISANFVRGDRPTNHMADTDVAGVQAVDNWNNVLVTQSGPTASASDLNDSDGNSTTLDVSLVYDFAGNANNGTNGNTKMMSSFVDADGDLLDIDSDPLTPSVPGGITFSQVPTDLATTGYDLLVYFDRPGDVSLTADITVGLTTFYATERASDFGIDQTFDRVTNIDENTREVGNYVIFQNLNATSFLLNGNGSGGGDRLAITGVQFVEIPEPASLALLGAGGLCLLGRRRSA